MTIKYRAAAVAALIALFAAQAPAHAQVVRYMNPDGYNNTPVDSTHPLPVTVSGGGSNAAASATGSAVPANAGYGGVNVSGTLRGQTGTNTSGSVYAADTNIVNAADGSLVTLGAKTDAKSTATDTTSVSAMSVLKQISASAQAGVSTTAATAPSSGVYVTGRAATASPTAVTDGQAVGVQLTEGGRTVTAPYAVKELMVRGTVTSTDTSAHTIIAAGGASVKTYVVAIQCGRTDSGTNNIALTFNDSASSVFVLPPGATNIPLPVPLVTAANTAFQVTSGTGVSTLYCSAQGYSGP